MHALIRNGSTWKRHLQSIHSSQLTQQIGHTWKVWHAQRRDFAFPLNTLPSKTQIIWSTHINWFWLTVYSYFALRSHSPPNPSPCKHSMPSKCMAHAAASIYPCLGLGILSCRSFISSQSCKLLEDTWVWTNLEVSWPEEHYKRAVFNEK